MYESKIAAVLFVITGMMFFATAAVSGEPVFFALGVTFVALSLYLFNAGTKENDQDEEEGLE